MTPADLRAACDRHNMTGIAMAAALGTSPRSWWRWLATGRIPHWVAAKLDALDKRENERG